MRVLIIGAGGFLGRHLAGRLAAEGLRVTAAGRAPRRLQLVLPSLPAIACDLARDGAADWMARLNGIDAVINCAGLFGDGGRRYGAVHETGARVLFDACRAAGVRRVIQVSALGADERAVTRYHLTKCAADDHLAALGGDGTAMDWVVLRPSLIIGRGARSTRLFAALAAAPLPLGLAGVTWQVQPIHVDDVAELVVRLLRRSGPTAARLDVVGPEPMGTDELTHALRNWLSLPPRAVLHLPEPMLAAAAWIGQTAGIGVLTPESLAMLRAGNVADATPLISATGFRPAPLDVALSRTPSGPADLVDARLVPLRPVLRLLAALIWLAGGIIPLTLTPLATNFDLLDRVGITGPAAPVALVGAALADMAVGLTFLVRPRAAAVASILLTIAYSLILIAFLPELWVHPFGPLVKNLAVIGLALALLAVEADHD